LGIVPIQLPSQGIVGDVLTDGGQFPVVARRVHCTRVFVKPALPKWRSGVIVDSVDVFGGLIFVIGDNLAQCGAVDFRLLLREHI
jgi:hypothetical protein